MSVVTVSPEDLAQAADWIRSAAQVVVMTGAGVSAESGIKTFRDADGLWRTRDPMSLATPEAFAADPQNVWAFYRWRQHIARACEPNAGHLALTDMQMRCRSLVVVTQNVDGLHQRAGTKTVTLHGDLYADRCTSCGREDNVLHQPLPGVDPSSPSDDPPLPHCTSCGSLMRPGVVWFGESLPEGPVERAAEAASAANLMLIIGTSGVVYPAAGLAELTQRNGGRIIVVNPGTTPHTSTADLHLRGTSASVLPRLVDVL
ncbi:MAG: NAD-dependent deacetylase [Bradymonadia bacterium]|jgi:NAD-dependent deacetylase